jgi:glycosyltransferase involved in cell wall biosynthesis
VAVLIDVTGSCRSAKNTGIQRVTRRIYTELTAWTSVLPICWNRIGGFYHLLGEREMQCLTSPFKSYGAPVGRPEFRGERLPGELRRFLGGRSIDLLAKLQRKDALLVPDIYSDGRTEQLPAIIGQAKTRAVAVFHDAAGVRLNLFSRREADRFRRYIVSLAAFDLVICVSQESRTDLVDLWNRYNVPNPPQSCVEGWPLGFDEKERSFERHSSRNVVLCVGSFEARKNHLNLLQAANQLWDEGLQFELQLVGRSTGAWGHQVIPRIRLLQAQGRPLYWLKHINDHALHHAYRESKFTVYPSRAEGFGLPILESLWHGKPCVCGSNGALGEVGKGGGCILLEQTSVAALAQGMKLLLTDEAKYNALAAEAPQRKFRSWPGYTADLMEHLRPPQAIDWNLDVVDAELTSAAGRQERNRPYAAAP